MKLSKKSKLAFLLPLDRNDLQRLISSVKLIANSLGKMRHYRRLSNTPAFILTAIGGWSISRTVIAYSSLAVAYLVSPYRADAIGFFLLNLLFSFGQRFYVDSMIRLYILRRLRATPESRRTYKPSLCLHYRIS